MTDFRALCAELTDTLDYWLKNSNLTDSDARDLVEEARAALAQPEPQEPTVMEIIELHDWLEAEWRANNDGEDLPVVDFARAVLARWACPLGEPMTKPLSSAAQAVLNGFRAVPDLMDGPSIASALRAAADQVVPELGRPRTADERTLYHEGRLDAVIRHRQQLLAIAAELEGQ